MSKLQDHRKASGMSQSQLADRTGLSVRTLQHYEQGSMDLNKAATDTVRKLAQALDCTVEDILEAEN